MPRPFSDEVSNVIVNALARGMSRGQISGVVGISKRAVTRISSNLVKYGTPRPPSKGLKLGRPARVTRAQADAMLAWIAERNHNFYVKDLAKFLQENHNYTGSQASVRRCLVRAGFRRKLPYRRSEITTWLPPDHPPVWQIVREAADVRGDQESEEEEADRVEEQQQDVDIDPSLQDHTSSALPGIEEQQPPSPHEETPDDLSFTYDGFTPHPIAEMAHLPDALPSPYRPSPDLPSTRSPLQSIQATESDIPHQPLPPHVPNPFSTNITQPKPKSKPTKPTNNPNSKAKQPPPSAAPPTANSTTIPSVSTAPTRRPRGRPKKSLTSAPLSTLPTETSTTPTQPPPPSDTPITNPPTRRSRIRSNLHPTISPTPPTSPQTLATQVTTLQSEVARQQDMIMLLTRELTKQRGAQGQQQQQQQQQQPSALPEAFREQLVVAAEAGGGGDVAMAGSYRSPYMQWRGRGNADVAGGGL